MPRALVTGVQGQTGYYLAEILLSQGWDVHGTANVPRADNEQPEVQLHACDFETPGELVSLLERVTPDLVVNLAAISSVAESWKFPRRTFAINTSAVGEIGEFLTTTNNKQMRIVQASSSEIFGNPPTELCDETTPLNPISPYGVSKAAAHQLGQMYRNAGYNWSNAILFNHESPRRPLHFLSRKVSNAVARISLGLQEKLELGDLAPSRDWGWAPDYAEAIHQVSICPEAGDFVIASGESHSAYEFVKEAFACVGITEWEKYVGVSSELIRPSDVRTCVGNPDKLLRKCGWTAKTNFNNIVRQMVEADLWQLSKTVNDS